MSATQTIPYYWHQTMPRLGTGEQFSALRRLLREADYSDEGIRRRLDVSDLLTYSSATAPERPLETPLDALIRLFFDCKLVERAELVRVLPAEGLEALESLDLVVADPSRPGMAYASVAILVVKDVITVCDRGEHAPDGSRSQLPPDVVYPAVLETTQRFLADLPEGPCEAMLDVGTGTGIAGLLGAPQAGHVWATDITARAVRFAEFNRRIAGVENMTVLEGDMYAPVEGLTFDRITIHPPYVPAKESRFVFRDAGADGEQIIRRAVQGLPGALRPGGRFYSLQLSTDREGETFEQRVRKWLGPTHEEYDVIVGAHTIRTPAEFLADNMAKQKTDTREPELVALWKETKTKYLVYAMLLIERHITVRPPVTGRIQTGKGCTGRHLDWLLDWQKACSRPDAVGMLMNCRPALSPHTTLNVLSRVQDGRFQAEEYTLKSAQPFRSTFRCQGWVLEILNRCDGETSWAQLFEYSKGAGLIGADVPPKEFVGLLSLLASLSLLRIPDRDLPPSEATEADEE